MIYQLPNGKVIHLSIDQYLDLTDEDIQYMMSINYGDHATSPWYGSVHSKKKKRDPDEDDDEDSPLDKSMDYHDEDEDKSHGFGVEEESSQEEFPDIPDQLSLD